MTTEEKAKAYDKALERAREIVNNKDASSIWKDWMKNTFPELKESGDEKIRKALVRFHKSTIDIDGIKGEDIIAWLEKQGEQKPVFEIKTPEESLGIDSDTYNKIVDECIYGEQNLADTVEPKFKVGDWIARGNVKAQIIGIEDNKYCFNGYKVRCSTIDKHYHLWTIQDAKDGDVLACGDKVTDCPFIFHNLTKELNPRSYCGVNTLGHFQDNDENGGFWCKSYEVRPATKEQRDLLFEKMHEAGYMWDSESKQLLSLKAEPMVEQKPAWSEEDENHIIGITQTIKGAIKHNVISQKTGDMQANWLKSLKERIGG